MVRTSSLVLVLCLGAACGGETNPTEPPPPPAATIVAGSGTWTNCTNYQTIPNVCDFTGEVQNTGPDCASSIRGVVRFYDAANRQVGSSENWTAGTLKLRPNEVYTYRILNVSEDVVIATETFEAVPSWTAVRC